MTRRKSAVNFPFTTPFMEGEIVPGVVYDLPDSQPDGSEIIWPDEFWVNVDKPTPVSPVTPENESNQ